MISVSKWEKKTCKEILCFTEFSATFWQPGNPKLLLKDVRSRLNVKRRRFIFTGRTSHRLCLNVTGLKNLSNRVKVEWPIRTNAFLQHQHSRVQTYEACWPSLCVFFLCVDSVTKSSTEWLGELGFGGKPQCIRAEEGCTPQASMVVEQSSVI